MLGILKSILGGNAGAGPRFAGATLDIEAKLTPVGGASGRGEVEYEVRANGEREFKIEISGAGDGEAEIVVNGLTITRLACVGGSARAYFSSARGDAVRELAEGDKVEVRRRGVVILAGVARPD